MRASHWSDPDKRPPLLPLLLSAPLLVAAEESLPSRRLQSWWSGSLRIGGWETERWDESLVDSDTPGDARYTSGLGDGALYRLVMSDEFEAEGRRFGEEASDPRWTAVSRHDPTNGNLAYMTPQMVSTRAGNMEIRTTNTGFRAAMYASASVQSWNKVCVQGGIVEATVSLPGAAGRPGVWPAVWMLGNLGRATYPLSTDGLWPFSFGDCDADRGSPPCDHGASSRPYRNRGVPEIDILEARPCADIGASGDRPELAMRHANTTCGLATLQISPRLPLSLRPPDGRYPSPTSPWYRNLSFGQNSELDILWYGGGHFDSIGAYFPLPAAVHSPGQGRHATDTAPVAEESLTTFRFEYEPGIDGFMRWYVDGSQVLEVLASSLGQYRTPSGGGVGQRLVPEEPMYLILSVAVSRSFSGGIDESLFPTIMRVGHVRVYQRADWPQRLGCSPADHPTQRWIEKHWWANGQQAPPEVDSLLRVDQVAYGAAGALGLLALLEGGDKAQTRLPLALVFGASLTAVLAAVALSRYLGVGAHSDGETMSATPVSSTADEAAASLATFLSLASADRDRERSVDRDADLAHERSQAAEAAKVVADHLVYVACVLEAAAVGGLLLTILSDLTLAIATAYSACLLVVQAHRSSPSLHGHPWWPALSAWWAGGEMAAMPPPAPPFASAIAADTALSLALLPVFLAVLLGAGLAAIHVRETFLAVSTALAGAQLAVLSFSALLLSHPHPLRDATDVLHLLAGTPPTPAAPEDIPTAAFVAALVILSLLRQTKPRHALRRSAVTGCAAVGACLRRGWPCWGGGAKRFGFSRLEDEGEGREAGAREEGPRPAEPREEGAWKERAQQAGAQETGAREKEGAGGYLNGVVSVPTPPLPRWPAPAVHSPSPAVARALELARRRAAWLLPGAGSSLSDIVALYTAAGDDDDIRPDTGGEEGSSLGRAWREAASAAPPLPPRVVADAAAALGTAPVARLLSLSSASALAFGFQPSVVSHQCEHLLGLLSARAARPGGSAASAAVAVHAALFAPYLLWCDHVGAVPQCSRDGAAPEACEAETLLFLLIWAEAANLRHAPEAVWWVYHQLSTDGRLPAPFLPAVIAPLYSASLVLMRKREPALNYDDLNEAFWHPRCLAWALVGSGAGSASSELLRLRKTYRERRSWLHVLGSFERVYFAHWLLLRGVLCAAVGAHTCVAAEFGAICDAKRPAQSLVRMLQLEATCVVDLQVYRVTSGLLRLWTRFPRLGPAELLDAVLRVALDLLLSLLLNIELWFALRTGSLLHWVPSLLLAAAAFGLPALSSLAARTPNAARSAPPDADHPSTPSRPRRLRALLGGESVGGALPTRPHSHVSWHALAFWLSLFTVHCGIVYCYIAGQLVVDTLSLLYSYFGRSLTGAPGIGGAQLLVLLLCIWVPVALFFLVSFSLTFTLWVMGVGLYRGAARLRLDRERGLPDLLARHFDPAADRLERRFLHDAAGRAPAASGQGGGPAGSGLDGEAGVWAALNGEEHRGLPSQPAGNEKRRWPASAGALSPQAPSTQAPPPQTPLPASEWKPPEWARAFFNQTSRDSPELSADPEANTRACSPFPAPPSPASVVKSFPGSPSHGSSHASSPQLRRSPSLGLMAAQLRPSSDHDPPRKAKGRHTPDAYTRDASPLNRQPAPMPVDESDVSGGCLLGFLPSTGGWGFAQAWNRMLTEMRTEDLVSDAEVASLQFAIVPRHSTSMQHAQPQALPAPAPLPPPAGVQPPLLPLLIPPPLGSLKRALGQLLGGCQALSLPTLSRLSLAAACDIATRLTASLLGPLHASDLAAASDALLAVLPPFLPHTRHAPLDGTLPPALRSERVVRGVRKSILALCDAIAGMMLAHAAEGAEGGGASGRGERVKVGSPGESGKAGSPVKGDKVGSPEEQAGVQTPREGDSVAALLHGTSNGSLPRDAEAGREAGHGSAHKARRPFAALRGAISSSPSLTQLRARALDASAYASVSLRELEKIRAQVSLRDLSRLDLSKLHDLPPAFLRRSPAAPTGVRVSDLASPGAAAVRAAALPGIQQALAALLACLQHACLAAASHPDTPGGLPARAALRTGASALQRSLAHPRDGFWADSAYASATLLQLLQHEPHLEMLTSRLRRLLSLSPTPSPIRSAEAMRRIRHWLRSLGMDAPAPGAVAEMASWSILTPVYKETVLYSEKELREESNDGSAFLQVLQSLHSREWRHFAERMRLPPSRLTLDAVAADPMLTLHVRLWASRRGQTLARTVFGMMHYEAALGFLATLEHGAGAMPRSAAAALARRKVRYVCACQVYGEYRRTSDPRARDIETLLHTFPSLRVAYVNMQPAQPSSSAATPRGGVPLAPEPVWAAALVRSDGRGGIVTECRVELPGDPILGEGKPENQNLSLPFCHGEYVQLIDMNQEGYWEEAIKMRPLLREFHSTGKRGPVTIVGFPEHIFTQSSGFVTAIFMGLQERYFGSFVQRVLDEPLDVRLHYGHPDLLDKLHFLPRGGVSKASKEINLSEDVFGGLKTVMAGGSVVFREYHQVGKGRPTNLLEISGFFAKLSSGCAAAVTTRDIARLTDSLPLVRLCSFYYSCIAFYLHDVIVLNVTVLIPYLLALLALVGLDHEFNNYDAQPFSLFAMMPLVLALATCVPALAMVVHERGPSRALAFLLGMTITASPVYFVFVSQTKSFHFARTVTAGGATYFAARRNASVLHTPFHELYSHFAPSHLYVAADVAAFLSLAHVFSVSPRLLLTTWPTWCVAGCFALAPLLYNPQQLEWWQMRNDARGLAGWLTGGGWEAWQSKLRAPPQPGGMAAEAAAWSGVFGQTLVAFFYGFLAYLIPLKAEPIAAAAGSTPGAGWTCDSSFVAAALVALAALLALAAADLRSSAAAPSLARRRGCYVAAGLLATLAAGLATAAALQPGLGADGARKRSIVALQLVYVCACALNSALELLAALKPLAPAVAPLLRLVHKTRDYALSAAILAPLALLAALRLPGRVHKALIFQQSFVDLDARGQLLYAAVLATVAVAYALGHAHWGGAPTPS